jgi:hypothetical protein
VPPAYEDKKVEKDVLGKKLNANANKGSGLSQSLFMTA